MSWEPLKRSLADFDRSISCLGVAIGEDAPVAPQLILVREFLTDHTTMSENDLLVKWPSERFKEFYDAAIVVCRLTECVAAMCDQPAGSMRRRLTQVLSGSLTQDFTPEQAKDIFYELEIATILKKSGFTVALREPDVVVSGNGLTGDLGMACKYPSSNAQIHNHLSKGYRQLDSQNMDGCVVIGLDLIVLQAAFCSAPKFLDLRQGDKHPLTVAQRVVGDAMRAMIAQRQRDYPSERAIDGAVLTFSVWGIWGEPARFAGVTAWEVQCDVNNPRIRDIQRLTTVVRDSPPRELDLNVKGL